MQAIGRLFAALIGFIFAVAAAALFMLVASVGVTPLNPADSFWFWSNFGVDTAFMASYLGAMALAPWAVLIVVSEAFHLRALTLYLAAGALLGALPAFGLAPLMPTFDGDPRRIAIVIASGVVGGFVYWLIAGRMAGIGGVLLTRSGPQPKDAP